MKDQAKPSCTQRAYTLRLRGADPKDRSWREALWRTHEAVNRGAAVFGGWLLTLRGGLDHTLAEKKKKKGKEAESEKTNSVTSSSPPSPAERKTRRILLALSWLSVESKLGAPEKFIIASGQDDAEYRNGRVVAALEEILKNRNLANNEIDEWKNDCSASLCAAIRDDAVWVNRSLAFDEAVKSVGCSLTRKEVWDMLEPFFGSSDAYLAPAKGSEEESSEAEQEEKSKDLVQKARQWLSRRFGTGKGADFSRMADVYGKIAAWAENPQESTTGKEAIDNLAATLSEFTPASNDLNGVLGLISGPGYKSATRNLLNQLADNRTVTQNDLANLKDKATTDAQKCKQNTGSKGQRPYSDMILKNVESVCGFTYLQYRESARISEFSVILDHAARRVSLAHTWIKRAEAERSKFEDDAKKVDQVPKAAKDWLDQFCMERSSMSGALEPYRLRRRAVDGWKEVVSAWSKSVCKTAEDRIAAARALQDDPEIDKFGDIQLFEALAEDNAVCVWHEDGDATKPSDPRPLIDYVLATEAEFKKRHFKVPAYCHPDALLHPVFCDFGESRWSISYDIRELGHMSRSRKLNLTLWIENGMKPLTLFWQSKRLAQDLALGQNAQNAGAPEVARADRLGRAASHAAHSDEVNISGLFEQKKWNGRLQAPRQQLKEIAAVRDNPNISEAERDHRIATLKDRLRWLVTFSARLQPQGPWCDFAETNQLRIDPQYWPHADANKTRKGQARLILSRLPGLRVLSVDLGHRYAAACAVWEAVSAEQVRDACRAHGQEGPCEKDLFWRLKEKVKKQKKGKEVAVEKTTVYRRIGADTLQDGTLHPAPWARLDRQFLIKLQGEEEGVREASNEEIWKVHQLETELGRTAPIIDRLVKAGWGQAGKQKTRLDALRNHGWTPEKEADGSSGTDEGEPRKPSLSVDELMSSAIRTMRLALQRHGDRARIAFAMTADYKPMPGDRRYYFTKAEGLSANDDQTTRGNKHIEFLQDALMLWHGLASSRGWRDDAAKQLWNDHITHLTGYEALEEIGENVSGVVRKKKQRENREKLYDVAAALAQDMSLRNTLHDAWKTRWENDDERWKKQLRWFKDWILPRGKHASGPTIRKVGGLSLPRLATLTEYRRKVQVGFFTRLQPDGTRAETKEQFGQRALNALEHLREQRVKQLASRIVEAALGIGRMKRTMGGKDPKRPNGRVDEPCHAIVIEDLTHYRPEETRTRRENRQLMTWSSSKVKKYLAEACQLHGLHLREVSAGYTSRQDSRTGAPGIRCQDIPVSEFMGSTFWRKQVAQAEEKKTQGKGDARDRFLCTLNAQWKDKTRVDWKKAGTVRVPLQGGELFVSADPASPAARGLQADLNAAANIGLRALMDPDWPGKWWYVPCEPDSSQPHKEKVAGSEAVKPDLALRRTSQAESGEPRRQKGAGQKTAGNADHNATGEAEAGQKEAGKKRAGRAKEVVNLWRDISASPLESPDGGEWKVYAAYQHEVQCRVIQILEKQLEPRHGQRQHSFSVDDDGR